MKTVTHSVLAYYYFGVIDDPHEEVRIHKEFFEGREATSRIYISEEGINGQMSASIKDAEDYIAWMHSRPAFKHIHFKIHPSNVQVFPRLTIKYRKQLVALDRKVDPSEGGEHVSPTKWKEMLESKKEYLLLDVRNDYEWKVGHFEGADLPKCNTFREFNEFADKIEDKSKPVMMYCTGGIRCELYSTVLKQKGFKDVYQLDGGIINYGLKEGSKHWLGKLFVFDDRITVPISDEETPTISTCHFCNAPADTYYNCSNMDCNTLFISCDSCSTQHKGCCQESCKTAPRVRAIQMQNPRRPFRRKHLCCN